MSTSIALDQSAFIGNVQLDPQTSLWPSYRVVPHRYESNRLDSSVIDTHISVLVARNIMGSSISPTTFRPSYWPPNHVERRQQEINRQKSRLDKMRNQLVGWDGYNAAAPDSESIDKIKSLLDGMIQMLLPVPASTMNSKGKAALFLDRDGYYLDLEVEEDGQISWLLQLPGGSEIEAVEPYRQAGLPERLYRILVAASWT